MGRRPSTANAIPKLRVRVQKSGKKFYYYDHGGKPRREEPLGSDYGLAVKRWAEIQSAGTEKVADVVTFRYVANQYRIDVLPLKSPRTQKDNRGELARLISFFDDPPIPLDQIQPVNVRQYLRWRKDAPVRANREKALLSHIWNYARDKGYTALPNPCAGIKGYEETGREVYVEDDAFAAIWKAGDDALKDAMDLAYLTGQRPSDTLRMSETDIKDGVLRVRQAKTDTPLRVVVEGELAQVIARIKARKAKHKVYVTRLVVNDKGMPVSLQLLQRRFVTARIAAGLTNVQFRDLRAKAATDKADDAGDMRQAQQLLGHSTIGMTEHYVRSRLGQKVSPVRGIAERKDSCGAESKKTGSSK